MTIYRLSELFTVTDTRRICHIGMFCKPKYKMKERKISYMTHKEEKYLFIVTLRPNAGHGLLILEVSRSHITTHHSP
jgi:hypothetical protein